MPSFKPSFTITSSILNKMAAISEVVGTLSNGNTLEGNEDLIKENRVKNIYSSCVSDSVDIEYEDVEMIVDGDSSYATNLVAAKNYNDAYSILLSLDPYSTSDMLALQKALEWSLSSEAGMFRLKAGGAYSGETLKHSGTSPDFIEASVKQLLEWAKTSTEHPIITSTIVHYQLEYIYPFADGNGKVGRLWQMLFLYRWKPIFAYLPLEELINQRQDAYYESLHQANITLDAAPFIEFILDVIYDAIYDVQPQFNNFCIPEVDYGDYYDEPSERPVELSIQVEKLMNCIGDRTLTGRQIMEELGLHHRQSFRKLYIQPALEMELIEMTVPDKPNSRNQRYRKVR